MCIVTLQSVCAITFAGFSFIFGHLCFCVLSGANKCTEHPFRDFDLSKSWYVNTSMHDLQVTYTYQHNINLKMYTLHSVGILLASSAKALLYHSNALHRKQYDEWKSP